jgi:hypothetical protein
MAPGRFVAGLVLLLAASLSLPARCGHAQWGESPPIDPFERVARATERSEVVPPAGPGLPQASVPMNYGVPGLGAASVGANSGPPQYGTVVAGPPPFQPQGPAYQMSTQLPQPVPDIGPCVLPIGSDPAGGQVLLPAGSNSAYRLLDHLEGNVVARGYYRNDQRIEWTGMESTFGAEGVLTPRLRQQCGEFEFVLDSELNINQPFDQNMLLDDAERRSYAANFQVNTLDVSQLALVTNYQDWTFKAGKFVTPFGRTYFPLYTNSYWDAPFIRTEVIAWRETGMLAHYRSGFFVADLAITNGGGNLQTNSGKTVVGRIGLEEADLWAIGFSARKGAGNGSESHKEFNNYYGVDMMFRIGPFQLSSECVYNEYGFGRPGMDPMDITWVKSIYYRDVSSGQRGTLCTGFGYYVNLGYAEGRWNTALNYGDFYPLYSGSAPNQRVQHRLLGKVAYQLAKPLQLYSELILENGDYIAQENAPRKPLALLEGFQLTF